jgi:hypothetical protein
MMIAACPYCGEQVLVPASIDGNARVACPLCQSTYSFAEVKLPPQLVVLDLPAPVAVADRAAIPPISGEQAALERAMAEAYEPAYSLVPDAMDAPPAPKFDFGPEPSTSTRFEPRPIRAASGVRANSRNRNVGVEFIKILLGGMAGLIIAQGILWWLPADWRRDPLGLAPELPGSLAFLAPAELRGQGAPSNGTGANAVSNDTLPSTGRADADLDRVASRFEGLANEDTSIPGEGVRSGQDDDVAGTGAAERETPDDRGHLADSADTLAGGGAAGPEPTPRGDQLVGAPSSVDDMIGVRDPPSFRAQEVTDALAAVDSAEREWLDAASAQAPQRKAAAVRLFDTLYQLAWKATFLDSSDPQQQSPRVAIERLLTAMGKDPNRVDLAGNAAASWLSVDDRSTNGVLLAGTVTSISPQGLFHATRLELAGKKKPTVTILSPFDPSRHGDRPFRIDDRLLLLGAIITDPALGVIGYEGTESTIVWCGDWVILPPAAPNGQ